MVVHGGVNIWDTRDLCGQYAPPAAAFSSGRRTDRQTDGQRYCVKPPCGGDSINSCIICSHYDHHFANVIGIIIIM